MLTRVCCVSRLALVRPELLDPRPGKGVVKRARSPPREPGILSSALREAPDVHKARRPPAVGQQAEQAVRKVAR